MKVCITSNDTFWKERQSNDVHHNLMKCTSKIDSKSTKEVRIVIIAVSISTTAFVLKGL